MTDFSSLKARLDAVGQGHLLRFWDDLSASERAQLTADIEGIDFGMFRRVWEQLSGSGEEVAAGEFDVADALPSRPTAELEARYARAGELGERLIGTNRVAALLVAGGQATRLGFDGPKGGYPIGPISGKCLFQLFGEAILATNRRYGCAVPWYVMTSSANHSATVELFERCGWFGLQRADVQFFRQGMLPVANTSGEILLDQRHRVSLAPNGHGGSLTALAESGMLGDMADRGVECISYFQVDNPLVHPVDPLFVGLHALAESEMSSLTIGKASDDEKVGHFVKLDEKLQVVEYTSFPAALSKMRLPDGSRKFDLANIAVHLLDRKFVERIVGADRSAGLPWHLARKKVAHIDPASGERVSPASPNAIKAEMFVFDALREADRAMLLRTTRGERFSPVKNLEGVDSAATARRDLVRRAAGWLEACGTSVPRTPEGEPDCVIEISPLYALDAAMLGERATAHAAVERGSRILLE